MNDKLQGRLILPKEIFGSDQYSITIELTNLTDNILEISSIDPELIPGEILSIDESSSTSELDELDELKRKLVKELELQIAKAYDKIYNKPKATDLIFGLLILYVKLLKAMTVSLESKIISLDDESKPSWASQALKINEWDDIEKLEEEIIKKLKDDSFIKTAFEINKMKLKNCLDKISLANNTKKDKGLDSTISIQSKETVSFPFRCIAPYRFSTKEYDFHFTVAYRNKDLAIQGNLPVRDSLRIYTSKSAITFGAVTGALLGFAVKNTIITSFQWFDKTFWSTLIGSITLAVIFGISTTRSSESRKIFTIENFAGGLLIGALCALYSGKLINYLEKFIPQ